MAKDPGFGILIAVKSWLPERVILLKKRSLLWLIAACVVLQMITLGRGRTSRRALRLTPDASGVRDLAHGNSLNRVCRPAARDTATDAPDKVVDLSGSLVCVQHGRHPVEEREGRHVRPLWPRLRRHSWWRWLDRLTRS